MRDLLVIAMGATTAQQIDDAHDSLWLTGRGAVADLGDYIMVVAGDQADLLGFMSEVPGEWLIIGDPEQLPSDWGEPFDGLLAAWALTCREELVVAENGGRPDEDQYFEILGGCGQ